jgi:hypothetical protein
MTGMLAAVAVPRHALTEQALLLLLHAQRTLAEPLGRQPLRSPARGGRIQSATRVVEEAALLRLVSITESFLDALSLQAISGAVDARVPIVGKLVEEFEMSATSSWPKREEAFKNYHGVLLTACAGYKDVQAAIQVRNCIAHGLGRLTPRQRRNRGLPSQVSSLNVAVGSGRMHLGDSTISITGQACGSFIRAVDLLIT